MLPISAEDLIESSLDFVLRAGQSGIERFLHISTDEVYGPRTAGNPSHEDEALTPANPSWFWVPVIHRSGRSSDAGRTL